MEFRLSRMLSCVEILICLMFFFFKQKTAYEIVSRDWSSDVCSSDLDHASLLSYQFVNTKYCLIIECDHVKVTLYSETILDRKSVV